jgi:uncharacterized protein YndB with AHSA1/START domain
MTNKEKPVGLTKDAGYQIGARRTLQASHARIWELVFSAEGLNLWLGAQDDIHLEPGHAYTLADGTQGEVRVVKPGSHVRLTWKPPEYPRASIIQVRVIDKGDNSVVAFHQEHLPDAYARDSRHAHFMKVLGALEQRLAA